MHMDASGGHRRPATTAKRPASDAADAADAGPLAEAGTSPLAAPTSLASGRDAAGVPVHRGWAPIGGRRRWMEPFVLVQLAGGGAHGYAITADLEAIGLTGGDVDIGQVYRTLRDLEQAGQVTSSWSNHAVGPQRREYELTEAGYAALDEWAAVMKERVRLIAEFDARYLEWVASPRRPRKRTPGAG
jgi:DNA-binding PadR family transcriptional regulator